MRFRFISVVLSFAKNRKPADVSISPPPRVTYLDFWECGRIIQRASAPVKGRYPACGGARRPYAMSFKKGVSAKPRAKAGLAAAERAVRRMWPSHRKREPIRPSTSLCYIRGRSRTDLADVSGGRRHTRLPLIHSTPYGHTAEVPHPPLFRSSSFKMLFFIASDPCLASALFRINKHFERCAEQEAMNILAFRPRTVRVKTHRPMLAPIKGAGIASPFPACQRVYRFTACGQGRIRTSELLRGLIYSQKRLTTSLPTHHQFKQTTYQCRAVEETRTPTVFTTGT